MLQQKLSACSKGVDVVPTIFLLLFSVTIDSGLYVSYTLKCILLQSIGQKALDGRVLPRPRKRGGSLNSYCKILRINMRLFLLPDGVPASKQSSGGVNDSYMLSVVVSADAN